MSCEARRKERFANAARGELRMRNQHKYRGYPRNWSDRSNCEGVNYPEPRTVSHATDFINVHTFGGRGSPSF